MIDALAASAVALVSPYLGKAAEEAAKTVGKEGASAGLKVLGWLRSKATGRAKEALDDAEANPASEDNKADLRKQLAKLLAAQTELQADLRALLPEQAAESVAQTATASENSIIAQNKGDQNVFNINR